MQRMPDMNSRFFVLPITWSLGDVHRVQSDAVLEAHPRINSLLNFAHPSPFAASPLVVTSHPISSRSIASIFACTTLSRKSLRRYLPFGTP
jgi:hypothetical protein